MKAIQTTKLKAARAKTGKPKAGGKPSGDGKPAEPPPSRAAELLEHRRELVANLKPHPRNYRQHPEDQLEHIKESIRRTGIYRNVVVANDLTILAGHGVVEAAKALGLDSVPIIVLPIGPTEPAALKVLTGDNEIGHLGVIDDRALSEILREIKKSDITGLAGTGYDDMMLANLVFVTRADGEIKDFDAAAMWAGVPGYEQGTDGVKLVIAFSSAKDRKRFCEEKDVRVDKTAIKGTTWSTRWPWTDREDVSALKFVTGEEPAAKGKKPATDATPEASDATKGRKPATKGRRK